MAETILIAEDEPVQRKMISTILSKRLGYNVVAAVHGKDALEKIQASNVGAISAVLLDINMPHMDGFEVLAAIQSYRPDLPVIVLTGSDDTSLAVKAIKGGASDFIAKPPDPAHLDITIKNAIRLSKLSRELTKMKRAKGGTITFSDLVGHNQGLADSTAYGRKAAACEVPVLITGESGVGKELFARAIHGESKRYAAPFVVVHCSAIEENQVESVLFDAQHGAFRRAEKGTLFLDDVGDLSPNAQVRLLTLLQQRPIQQTHKAKPVQADVRVIAASERDLAHNIKQGQFREDLYFRLNILPIHLLPLRERKQDIMALTEHFIEHLSLSEGVLAKILTPAAMHYVNQQSWPGNVRELENFIHRALVLTDGDVMDEEMLQQIHTANIPSSTIERRAIPPLHISLRHADGGYKTMVEIEIEAMRRLLDHFEQNVTRTADRLGIAKSTFYRKIKMHGDGTT